MTAIDRCHDRRRVLAVVRWPLGGIRTYLHYNYRLLLPEGYRFTFVGPADESFRTLARELQSWEGVEFVEAPLNGSRCRLRSTVRRLLCQRHFALIHSHGLTAAAQAVLANLGRKVPHVVTSHDVVRAAQIASLPGRWKLRLLDRLLSRADAVITVSRDARENHLQYLPALRRHQEKVFTILNGIDTARFAGQPPLEPPGPWRQAMKIPPQACLLGFLGRFMEQKGFLVLVDALASLATAGLLPRLHLLAVGSGDYLREYQAEIARRPGLASAITFLEHTPNIAPLLGQIDLLVMPSLWEACPLLPMEAMCAALPVLGSDCIGLREVLAGSPSPMVPAGDAQALAQGIRRALESPWKQQAAAYAPAARRRFDVQTGARQLAALFDRFVT